MLELAVLGGCGSGSVRSHWGMWGWLEMHLHAKVEFRGHVGIGGSGFEIEQYYKVSVCIRDEVGRIRESISWRRNGL